MYGKGVPDSTYVDCDAAEMRHALNRIERIATNGQTDPQVRCEQIEEIVMKLDHGASK